MWGPFNNAWNKWDHLCNDKHCRCDAMVDTHKVSEHTSLGCIGVGQRAIKIRAATLDLA